MRIKTTLLLFIATLFLYQAQAQCNGATFEEKNGIAVIEMETVNTSGSWKKESKVGPFTGSSYIVWRGSSSFTTPGKGLLEYKVKINSSGTYRFIWRNKVGIIANHPRPSTEHNDSWLKFPGAADFYAQKGGSRVYPKGSGKTPTAHGAGSGGWFKVYASGTTKWTWSTNANDENPHQIYVRFGSPGVYTIQVSARSDGHFIDRMVLYKESQYSASAAQSLSRGQTNCGGGSPPPPPPPPDDDPDPPAGNQSPSVNITNPNNGQNFNAGANVTVNLNANDPDGSISKHEIFVNGTRVDTDGSKYTAHTIQNIKAGSYAIRAKVTDNNGATAESTVNITVGSGNPPPPPPPSGDDNPTVNITSPNNGQNFSAGANVSVNLTASDSDGSVVKHEIFVNGTKVDTDGSNYTPHSIKNVTAGSYTVRAKVTDNDGNTAEDTVSFTVGGGTPPPPPPPSGGGNIAIIWINAKTNTAIRTLGNGSVISGFNGNRNIEAVPSNVNTKSIYFRLTGPKSQTWTENESPYALFGDFNGNYNAETFPNGTYNLTVEAYSGANRSGTKLESRTISFTVGSSSTSKSSISQQVYVFPNPIKDGRFSVKMPEDIEGEVFYNVISTSGAAIETGKVNVARAGDNAEFNLNSFNQKNDGVYYLMLQSANGASFTVPIVKQ